MSVKCDQRRSAMTAAPHPWPAGTSAHRQKSPLRAGAAARGWQRRFLDQSCKRHVPDALANTGQVGVWIGLAHVLKFFARRATRSFSSLSASMIVPHCQNLHMITEVVARCAAQEHRDDGPFFISAVKQTSSFAVAVHGHRLFVDAIGTIVAICPLIAPISPSQKRSRSIW